MTTYVAQRASILDDGEFYVELESLEVADAPGFLQRRCRVGEKTPGGYECVGSFDCDSQGRWQALVVAPCDPITGSDYRLLGQHLSRLDAIATLWGARSQALCRYESQ